MNPVHKQCRVYGHMWDSIYVDFTPAFYIETLKCERCGTERADTIMKGSGLVKGRQYKYTEGYQVPGNGTMDRYDRGKLRLSLYER